MRSIERIVKAIVVVGVFSLSGFLTHQFGAGGLWQGFNSSLAVAKPGANQGNYDLTRTEAVDETLKFIRDRYVEPDRVKPQDMLLSALNDIQRDVAQVIVMPTGKGEVTIRVDTHDMKMRVDDVVGPWDVSTKLRTAFVFLQKHLKDTDVDLRSVEYAACNGILRTLDPHSNFLSPEAYKEMNLSTSGHFGGLGIVISIRDQLLTVIRPMADTPAGRAGLKRLDRVMKINNESTLNMPLNDAVRRLRGEPGSKVTVWIAREDEWKGLRKFVLVRERIRVRSVLAKRLSGDVGYVRLKQFQATSSAEIREALKNMRAAGPLRGLVLDLRGNPGGLLDQAAKVADLFLTHGVVVATVGAAEAREEKRAHREDTEPNYPLVVLVNGSSASASEIVAGALKNLDRAVIVGQTTFGKGSVQLVFPDVTSDKAALKLTIAQYLTPGDRSIQGVGVTPHIELDPMTVDKLEMDLTVKHDSVRERDLSQALSNSRANKPTKPAQVVRYFLPKERREEIRELGGELDDVFQLDFPTKFARDLVRRMPKGKPTAAQLSETTSFIDNVRNTQMAAVSKALKDIGVDWSLPKQAEDSGPQKDDFVVTITTDKPNDTVLAGDSLNLTVTVQNNGTLPVYRLRGTTESDNAYFNEHELLLGKIAPGETRSATVPLSWCRREKLKNATGDKGSAEEKKRRKRECKIPKDANTRSDGVKVHFAAAGGHTPASVEIRPTIQALPRPLFQYSYQVVDDINGNGDGIIQRGEQVSIYLTVKNAGEGRSYETQANLSNRSGDGVLLRKGRFVISNMMPNDVRHVEFTFDVQKQLREDEVVLALSVGDRDLREFASEKLRLPVKAPLAISELSGPAITTALAPLFDNPTGTGTSFGHLATGTTVQQLGRYGDFTKFALAGHRFAFTKSALLSNGGSAPTAAPPKFDNIYAHAPPAVTVKASSRATRDSNVSIDVTATDGERLLDMYVFVGSRKLFYKSNRDGADPKKASFTLDVPLEPGVNIITVVARETPDTTTHRVVVVRRDGPDGSLLKTPKRSEDYLLHAVQ